MTWVANGLIVIGMILIGGKRRSAFLFSAAGELLWTGAAAVKGMWDLAFICGLFVVLALVNWKRWGSEQAESGVGVYREVGS